MKRIIAAVSFAILAIPAIGAETGAPFEQNQLDRDPLLGYRSTVLVAAAGGKSVSDASFATSTDSDASTDAVWANDHNFIAPPQ